MSVVHTVTNKNSLYSVKYSRAVAKLNKFSENNAERTKQKWGAQPFALMYMVIH